MSERKYSVSEIEALRNSVENKWLFGSYNPQHTRCCASRSYSENQKTQCVEELVRTHMLAGHTVEDLYASEQEG